MGFVNALVLTFTRQLKYDFCIHMAQLLATRQSMSHTISSSQYESDNVLRTPTVVTFGHQGKFRSKAFHVVGLLLQE